MWLPYVLLVLSGVAAVHSHSDTQGLLCLNDFINIISCDWHGSPLAPGEKCFISSAIAIETYVNNRRTQGLMNRTCKLQQHRSSPPGCSIIFENKVFNAFKRVPYITMECDGGLVVKLANYSLYDNVKMHPPGAPVINTTANDTWVSWSAGSPLSVFIDSFDFNIQVKEKKQHWREAHNWHTQELLLRRPNGEFKGHYQVRVRVKPVTLPGNHWSSWSPTTSWVQATPQNDRDEPVDLLVIWTLIPALGVILEVMPVLAKIYYNKRIAARKQIPNPSKYFRSVHNSNLKMWLNPLPASETFFNALPCDHISPIQLCESKSFDVAPSTSPSCSSTSALLLYKASPSSGSDTSGVVDRYSSSSSSSFSNMGYFLSSSSGVSARTNRNPAYFTYQDDFHTWNDSHNSPTSLCGPFATARRYESLKREPQSPDSGLGAEKEDEEENNEGGEACRNDCQASPLIILPLNVPNKLCPPSVPPVPSPSPPPPPASALAPVEVSPDNPLVETPAADAGGAAYAAWPQAGSMARSSSMNVESSKSKTGYLTLKELQTTFSNKSI